MSYYPTALIFEAIPDPASAGPMTEATGGQVGNETNRFALEDHQHPRMVSTTTGTIGQGGTAVVTFTRTFSAVPCFSITEYEGATGPAAMPTMFKVESLTPGSPPYTGCTVRAWKGQQLPQLDTVSGLLSAVITGVNAAITALTTFNTFGNSADGVKFTIIAAQPSSA